jgi:hypothetical protein
VNNYDPCERLRALFPSTPGRYKFSDSDAIATMVFTRELIEISQKASQFPVLNLFCNWNVHTELEGSMSGYRVLVAITDILFSTSDPYERAKRISHKLSSARLRHEIIELYSINNIPTHIFESSATWTMFGRHFLKAILGKRLRYPQNADTHPRAGSIYNAMVQKAGSRLPEAAKTIRLQSNIPGENNRVFWVIECFDGHEERGLYLNLEKDPDFSNPSLWQGKVAVIRELRKSDDAA